MAGGYKNPKPGVLVKSKGQRWETIKLFPYRLSELALCSRGKGQHGDNVDGDRLRYRDGK